MKCIHCNQESENNVCNHCLIQYYSYCDHCGKLTYFKKMNFNGYNLYCIPCYNKITFHGNIKEGSYKPNYTFYDVDNTNRKNCCYIGVEIEINNLHGSYKERNQFLESIQSFPLYFKKDLSIMDYGVEIVSMPMTYQYMKSTKIWETVFESMIKYFMTNTENCGLHFHIDKTYLNNINIHNIDYIVNTFAPYFEKIGGRPFNHYCKRKKKFIYGISEDRYEAVNLINSNTVELRFCKSTYKYKEFMQRLNMVFNLVEFVKDKAIYDIYNVTENEIISFFKINEFDSICT